MHIYMRLEAGWKSVPTVPAPIQGLFAMIAVVHSQRRFERFRRYLPCRIAVDMRIRVRDEEPVKEFEQVPGRAKSAKRLDDPPIQMLPHKVGGRDVLAGNGWGQIERDFGTPRTNRPAKTDDR